MKINPNIFLTADTHFGHSKIYREWGYRCENFEEQIIKEWNKVVSTKDTVLHLGDLTLTNKEKTKEWTDRLNGEKYLILGNHDNRTEKFYKDLGFKVIPPCLWRYKDKYENYYMFTFTHEPLLIDNWFNIHGHMHGKGEYSNDKHLDVGIDVFNKPIALYEILKSIL